jgi:hypothetical protein
MNLEVENATEIGAFGFSFAESIDFIANAFQQLFQLISCLVVIIVVGKVINLFASSTPPTTTEAKSADQEVETVTEPPAVVKESEVVEAIGWASEPLQDALEVPIVTEVRSPHVLSRSIKKQLKRKCISVGPVMLTQNHKIIRSFDAEEREERYRYDVLPLEPSIATDIECVKSNVPFVSENSSVRYVLMENR